MILDSGGGTASLTDLNLGEDIFGKIEDRLLSEIILVKRLTIVFFFLQSKNIGILSRILEYWNIEIGNLVAFDKWRVIIDS